MVTSPIPFSQFRDAQMHPEKGWKVLNPQVGTEYELASAPAPFEVMFDFRTLQGGDEVEIRIEVEVYGPEAERREWVLSARYKITIDASRPGVNYVAVNGEPVSESRLVSFIAPEGPWPARMTYVQKVGFNKPVRFIRWA